MGSVSAGRVANDGHFQSVSLCRCVCFGSECGGRRVWGRMEEDEEVENGMYYRLNCSFMCLLICGDRNSEEILYGERCRVRSTREVIKG